jgi:hypothetical protein
LKFLEQASKQRDNVNDIARLCHLVRDVGLSRQRSLRLEETVNTILHRLRPMNTNKKSNASKKKVLELGPKNVAVNGANKSTPRLRSPSRRRKSSTNATKKINGAM